MTEPDRPATPARPQAPPPGPQERVDVLRAELAAAEAQLPAPPGTVRIRVKPPHDSFTRGGITVGTVPTPVPAGTVTRLMAAAAAAGVTLEEA